MEAGGRFLYRFYSAGGSKEDIPSSLHVLAVGEGVSLRGASEELLQKQVQLQEGI